MGIDAAGDRLRHRRRDPRRARSSRRSRRAAPRAAASPRSYLDMPVDFDELTKVGSMMGSGGMIVMDEDTCMVDVARYFIELPGRANPAASAFPAARGSGGCATSWRDITEGKGQEGRHRAPGEDGRGHHRRLPLRAGQQRPEPGPQHDPLLPRRVRGPHQGEALSGRGLQGPDHVQHRPREVHGLHASAARSARRGRPAGERKKVHAIDAAKCTKCGACRESCKFDAIIVR